MDFEIGDKVYIDGFVDGVTFNNDNGIILSKRSSYLNVNKNIDGYCDSYQYKGVIYLINFFNSFDKNNLREWWVSPYNISLEYKPEVQTKIKWYSKGKFIQENINNDLIFSYNPDGKAKNNLEIIERLIDDTKKSKLQWHSKESIFKNAEDVVYTKMTTIHGDTRVDIQIQIVNDFEYEQYSEYGDWDDKLFIDIYFSKNFKKEVYCKRISNHQLKLTELYNEVLLHIKKRKKNDTI